MASGMAYRLSKPGEEVLNAYTIPPLGDSFDLDYSITRRRRVNPNRPRSAGFLGQFPMDIAFEMMLHLDLMSLEMFRCASYSCSALVDAHPVLTNVQKHARNTLRVMKIAGTYPYYTLAQLYAEFCQPLCRICGDFGPFLFLPTLTRCCETCHTTSPQLQTTSLNLTKYRCLDLKDKDFDNLCIVNISRPIDGSVYHKDRLVSLEKLNDLLKTMGKFPLPFSSNQLDEQPRRRYVATTAFPYYNRRTGKAESGVYCSACTENLDRQTDYRWRMGDFVYGCHRAFLLETIPQHFAECESIRTGYRQRQSPGSFHGIGRNFTIDYDKMMREKVEGTPASPQPLPKQRKRRRAARKKKTRSKSAVAKKL